MQLQVEYLFWGQAKNAKKHGVYPVLGCKSFLEGGKMTEYKLNAKGKPYDPFADPWIAPKGYDIARDKNPTSWERHKYPYTVNEYQKELREKQLPATIYSMAMVIRYYGNLGIYIIQ